MMLWIGIAVILFIALWCIRLWKQGKLLNTKDK